MTQSPRPTRPEGERTEPRRAARDIFDANNTPYGSGGSTSASQGEDAVRQNAAYSTVNNAYRMIDEYLREGQRMAERVWQPTAEPSQAGGGDLFNAPSRMLRALGELSEAWVDIVQTAVQNSGAAGRTGDGPIAESAGSAGPFTALNAEVRSHTRNNAVATSERPSTDRAGQVKLQVRAKGHVEVAVEFSGTRQKCLATDLRSLDQHQEVAEVRCSVDPEGRCVLEITVADLQPAGVYNGLILTEDGHKPCGTISLTVF